MIKDNFINYINNFENEKKINKKYDNYISNLPDDINNIPNIILYGPPGSGKYSEALKIVLKYSATKLKYEKKMIVKASKNEHIIKISDIQIFWIFSYFFVIITVCFTISFNSSC